MENTEESTPLTEMETDTSIVEEVKTDTPVDENSTESDTSSSEPEATEIKAEAEEKSIEKEPEQLYFGKYKTLEEAEKGYKEAEKSFNRAAELEKQLKAFQQAEEQAKLAQIQEAKRLGFSTPEEQAVERECREYECSLYERGLQFITDPKAREEAGYYFQQYKNSGNTNYLETAIEYMNPVVAANIAENSGIYRHQRFSEYKASAKQQELRNIRERVEEFSRDVGDWVEQEERQNIVGLAVKLTGGNVDLQEVKKLIDAVENGAVERYKQAEKAKQENAAIQQSLTSPNNENTISSGKKWLTREEYYNMPEADEAKYQDLINEQILLENQGVLPKQITA